MAKLYINDDWFFNDSFQKEMIMPDYDYSKFEKVRLPHTVKETPLHYFDENEYQKESVLI